MNTMINPGTANDRRRPSLNEQINRLDSMLDGLSDGLNEAVADAVKAGVGAAVKEAVQAVLTEMLTNPELRARLLAPAESSAKEAVAEATAPAPPDDAILAPCPNGWWQRARACIGFMRDTCADLRHTANRSVAHAWRWASENCMIALATCTVLWPFKYYILFALIVGASVGVGVSYAETWIAAITSDIGGFATTLTLQAALWLRKAMAIA